ncbi:hypothetical protein GGI20_002040 [Coemansia sp. BCRC 34301]|nr:hypothetical protein GGI20_002040 [Coemansia sp. BCRC 34301]
MPRDKAAASRRLPKRHVALHNAAEVLPIDVLQSIYDYLPPIPPHSNGIKLLRGTGFGNSPLLTAVERLRLDMSGCQYYAPSFTSELSDTGDDYESTDAFNKLLIETLPALSKIEFSGSAANDMYCDIPIDGLINEHLGDYNRYRTYELYGIPGHMASTRFGVPQFSPFWDPKHRITDDLDPTAFDKLQSLSIRHLDAVDDSDEPHINGSLSQIFSTASPGLQSMSLMLYMYYLFRLSRVRPAFAESLSTLTFEGHIFVECAALLLPQLTSMQRLNIFECVTRRMLVSHVVDAYKQGGRQASMRWLNKSVRRARSERLQQPAELSRWNIATDEPHSKVGEVEMHCGLLLDLVCRLPSLETLLMSDRAIDGMKKCIGTLTKANPRFKRMNRIRFIKLQAAVEHYPNLEPEYD